MLSEEDSDDSLSPSEEESDGRLPEQPPSNGEEEDDRPQEVPSSEEEEHRPHDLPDAVASPTKSCNSHEVSSPSSSESEKDDDIAGNGNNPVAVNLYDTVRHVDLLEPPHPYDPGRKPKALTRKEVFKIVTLPRCCRNSGARTRKGRAKCME